MTDVVVTQEDREAAASAYFAWIGSNPVIPTKMLAGDADDHSMVQAFARHAQAARLQSQTVSQGTEVGELQAQVERMREALVRIAEQKLPDEMSQEEYVSTCYEDGYVGCVEEARAALTPNPKIDYEG